MVGQKAATVQRLTQEAFRHTAATNPLRDLQPADRELLWAYLKIFSSTTAASDDEVVGLAAKTAAKGARLAEELDKNIFQGAAGELFGPHVGVFAVVTRLLRALNEAINLTGSPGHQGQLFRSQLLVMASEFVNHRLGAYYDEDLAELLQAVNDPSRNLDGGSISKNRNRLKKEFPHAYAWARAKARNEAPEELETSLIETAFGRVSVK